MKKKPSKTVEKYRVTKGPLRSDKSLGNNGLFLIPYKPLLVLTVIISDQGGWDHCSVSYPKFAPTWAMMCYIKNLFFEKDEVCFQYHPREEDYINHHDHCLHIWRPQTIAIPTPPTWMVGFK